MIESNVHSALHRRSAGPAPVRAPGSIRRTSSLDFSWPEGRSGNIRLVGRARDIVTPLSGGASVICAEDGFEALLKADRTIVAIEADPPRPALARLVGERGGGGLRRALNEVVPEERRHATPLYLILDDIAGASLVSAWAWAQWDPGWLASLHAATMKEGGFPKALANKEGVCIGFAPGSSALDHKTERGGSALVPDLRHPEDPEGWHAFTVQEGVIGMRRARRIDVRLDGVIVIDAAFQDSASRPAGGRAAVHEYTLTATADPGSLRVLSVEAQPRILPHLECPSAVGNLPRLIDTPLPELREKVLAELRGTAGCTHLNDALRALADVPALVDRLREATKSAAAC